MTRRLFAALCLLLALMFAGLGVWQLKRLVWKRELIAKVEARLHANPRVLAPGDGAGDFAYTRVRVRGVFLHDRETLVQAATAFGAGWWVMTPLRTDTGIVLVNRGFVPPERREPATRRAGSPAGTVQVVGLLRASEPGGGFLQRNDPAADRWHSRDAGAIVLARGIAAEPRFFIDADATPSSGGYPIGGLTVVAFRNNHVLYALTWFTLSSLALAGLIRVVSARWIWVDP